jgi:hypothetical protein
VGSELGGSTTSAGDRASASRRHVVARENLGGKRPASLSVEGARGPRGPSASVGAGGRPEGETRFVPVSAVRVRPQRCLLPEPSIRSIGGRLSDFFRYSLQALPGLSRYSEADFELRVKRNFLKVSSLYKQGPTGFWRWPSGAAREDLKTWVERHLVAPGRGRRATGIALLGRVSVAKLGGALSPQAWGLRVKSARSGSLSVSPVVANLGQLTLSPHGQAFDLAVDGDARKALEVGHHRLAVCRRAGRVARRRRSATRRSCRAAARYSS